MQHSGLSPLTLVVASVSSAAAAVVVRELWAPGTIASAAFTPLLVALFGELLHRPSQRLVHVARQRRRNQRNSEGSYLDRLLHRPARWERVGRTAIAAFVIGTVALTGWELLLHHSLASRAKQTTLWGGAVHRPRPSTFPRQTDGPPAIRPPTAPRTDTVTVGKTASGRHPQPPSKRPATSQSTTSTTATPSAPSPPTTTTTTHSGPSPPATTTTTGVTTTRTAPMPTP